MWCEFNNINVKKMLCFCWTQTTGLNLESHVQINCLVALGWMDGSFPFGLSNIMSESISYSVINECTTRKKPPYFIQFKHVYIIYYNGG